MITIALDEQGDFENLEKQLSTNPVFIGGILYDDNGDEEDYRTEKKRLGQYLKNVCEDAGGEYPKDLHIDRDTDNKSIVRKVKTVFGKTIKGFLEEGTWRCFDMGFAPRKGKYYIFAFLRGTNGKEGLLGADVSQAVRDDFASNLYIHMAEGVVERLLFHNPVIWNIDKVRLELATRRVVLEGKDRAERMKEYEKLGFVAVQRSEEPIREGTTEYILTNPTNYRTAVEREMLRSGKNSLMIDRIGVKSIFYKHPKDGMEFLYLSDAICSVLSFNRSGETADKWIESFDDLSQQINGNSRNLIWGYDEADEYFEEGWSAIEKGDYYTALSMVYDGSKCGSTMRDYYKERWYSLLTDAVLSDADAENYSAAIKRFKASLMSNNINQEKLVYIFEALEKLGENVSFSHKKAEAAMYDLYDAGVSAYTHIGDLDNAERCFEKTQQYAEYVTTEQYLRTRNRMVVFLCDRLEFSKALRIADENIRYHELLIDIKKQIFDDEQYESLNHAIALSQRGQVYAFLEDPRAEDDFLKALGTMDPETPDRLITESYLLHYYITMKEREKYRKLAREYFGGKNSPEEQFDYLVREGVKPNPRFSLKYALFVYVKALYEFYMDEIPTALLNRLKDIEVSLSEQDKNALRQINGQPWEIIYKYLALIMLGHDELDAARTYIEKLRAIAGNAEGIIREIAQDSLRIRCATMDQDSGNKKFTYMYT